MSKYKRTADAQQMQHLRSWEAVVGKVQKVKVSETFEKLSPLFYIAKQLGPSILLLCTTTESILLHCTTIESTLNKKCCKAEPARQRTYKGDEFWNWDYNSIMITFQ